MTRNREPLDTRKLTVRGKEVTVEVFGEDEAFDLLRGTRVVIGGEEGNSLTSQLADAFREEIRNQLTDSELRAIDERNVEESYRGCCATHDFLDANMAMHSAFTRVIGRQPRSQNDKDNALWTEAWSLAISRGFSTRD
jgi:hypothetical protein